jgi:WD40 repeat protein
MNTLRVAILLPALSLVTLSDTLSQEPSRTDRHGDPLPKGALQRLGTLRYCEPDTISAFAFSPDGKAFATCSEKWPGLTATVGLWNTTTGEALHRCATDAHFLRDIAFAPDGKTVAVAKMREGLLLFDVATGKTLRQLESHPGSIACFAWSPDGKMLAVSGFVSSP